MAAPGTNPMRAGSSYHVTDWHPHHQRKDGSRRTSPAETRQRPVELSSPSRPLFPRIAAASTQLAPLAVLTLPLSLGDAHFSKNGLNLTSLYPLSPTLSSPRSPHVSRVGGSVNFWRLGSSFDNRSRDSVRERGSAYSYSIAGCARASLVLFLG